MTLSPPKPITPEIFASVPATAGYHAIKPYPQSAAAISILRETLDQWHITPYRLGKLLGMTNTALVYQWVGGEKRPSPYYCILMIHIYQQVLFHKLDIRLVEEINWETGEIIYKGRNNGRKSGNGVSAGQRSGAQGQRDNRGTMAQFYNQSL